MTQGGDGLRTICDLNLREAPALSAGANPEPGDLILCRSTSNALSRLITRLDGYWSHSALYVGEGKVVHAAVAGVVIEPLDNLASRYPEGVGLARPGFEQACRDRAAQWALDLSDPENHTSPASYSGHDLGLAFELLRRCSAQAGKDALPEVEPDMLASEPAYEVFEFSNYESTCSGLVYRAYSEGAECPLEIVPAPGIRLRDARLFLPDEASLLDDLAAQVEYEVMSDVSSKLQAWATKARLIKDAAGARIDFMRGDGSIAIDEGVTPADLWCSPSMTSRMFLTPAAETKAKNASAHCA